MTGKILRSDDCIKYFNSDGYFHREDGPALEYGKGNKYWYIDGKLHREDGPAIEWKDGSREWYVHGCIHRVDGPAIERANGTKYWFINGVNITKEVNKWREDMGITNDYLTPEESILFMLYFGNVK